MNLPTQVANELSQLGTGGEAALTVTVDPRQLSCRIAERNPLAVSFYELALSTSELASASMDELQRLSESLSTRLNYLLEPIAPIEVDADQCVVQMRSNPPQKDDDGNSYYELLVRRGGQLALCRYRKQPGAPRESVAAMVTAEVFGRLVTDLDAVIDDFVA